MNADPTAPRLSFTLWQVTLIVSVIVAWTTWPQVAMLGTGLTDFGDPLLNTWALAWNARALVTAPWAFADANIFHPETSTLAYSELLLLPSLVVAPLIWSGVDPIVAHNLLVLGGGVSSGVATFVLVRRLTGHDGAALVAGVAFAVYPYRIEQFAKVQLALTVWWPVALIAIHQVFVSPKGRSVGLAAAAIAAEFYTCVYYGLFGAVFVAVVAGVLFLTTRGGRAAIARRLTLAALCAAVLTAPLAWPYRAASAVVGERSMDEVAFYSAVPDDYRRAHPESRLYGDDRDPGEPERRLFPGYITPLLALTAFVPPVAPAAAAYLAAGVVSVDLSFGVHAPGYAWLYAHVAPVRALRVPARFAMCAGLALAVLAGLGLARALRGRSLLTQAPVIVGAVCLLAMEGAMRPQELLALPDPKPAVYQWLAQQPRGVVCDYPVGNLEGRVGPQDPTYMYYSTQHWNRLVNGYSGFQPPSYHTLLQELAEFPDDRSIEHLRTRGVRYLLVHEPFYINGSYRDDVRELRARPDLRWAGTFPWRGGGTSDVFEIASTAPRESAVLP